MSSSASTYTVKITSFGQQSGSDEMYLTWSYAIPNTSHYEVEWDYWTPTNGIWMRGSRENVQNEIVKSSTYTPPSNATKVRARVKPISATYKVNDQEISYWTGSWTAYQIGSSYTPTTPPTPTVTIEGYTLTCKLDSLEDELQWTGDDPYVEFNILKNDVQSIAFVTVKIAWFSASYSCPIDPGYTYKVRARIVQGDLKSEWSDYSSPEFTKPSAPSGINSYRATSSTSVFLSWTVVTSAETYDIEYTTNKEYFEGSNGTTTESGIKTTQYELTGLESGERYFFRVRACNEKGESNWTEPVSVIIGSKPGAPTTWSSTTTAITGEELTLYWIHNSLDESIETMAELEVYYGSQMVTKTIVNEQTEDEEIKTHQYKLDTTDIVDGLVIKWRVRTAGITGEYGEWSIQRTIDVYAPPSLELQILDKDGEEMHTLTSFPFYIKGTAGPQTQTPLSFHVSIVSKGSYETVDEIGNFKMIPAGEEVYSVFFDVDNDLYVEILPNDLDLQSDIEYELTCTVAMNTGLTTSVTRSFNVSWSDENYSPNAELGYDKDTTVMYIRPYCEYYPILYYVVEYTNETWVKTDTTIDELEGIPVDNAFTQEGYMVFAGYVDNVLTHYCIVESQEPISVPDITLSVYRREFNGKFTEIGRGLINEENTFVVDPHPALDFARYRIVAVSNLTGAINYSDLPGYYVHETSVILQWDEAWSNFEVHNEGAIVDPPWAGSMLRLPYNIDVSESNKNDVSLISYIGREHPVSYYGTQVGSTATWNVEIPKSDTETLYGLRRLSNWMGNVYVREPSGNGYWASISLSFSINHIELVIPITINITRVEGGL